MKRCGTPSRRRLRSPCSAFQIWQTHTTHYEVQVPWVLGLIATRSARYPACPASSNSSASHAKAIKRRVYAAYRALHGHQAAAARSTRCAPRSTRMWRIWDMRCCSSASGPTSKTPRRGQIDAAAASTIPNVPVLFWAFRLMVALGFWFIALFAVAFLAFRRRQLDRYRRFLWAALLTLPLPWIAAELGWIVAEYGRQPWVIVGVLPTALGVSSIGHRQCDIQPARLCAFLFRAAGRGPLFCWENTSGWDRRRFAACRWLAPMLAAG